MGGEGGGGDEEVGELVAANRHSPTQHPYTRRIMLCCTTAPSFIQSTPLEHPATGQLKTIMDAQAMSPSFNPLPQLPGSTRVSNQRMRQREAMGLDALPDVRTNEQT